MSNTEIKRLTDGDILNLKKVTPKIAADYLSISLNAVRSGIEEGILPFGSVSVRAGKKYYTIIPALLVKYHNGELPCQQSIVSQTAGILSKDPCGAPKKMVDCKQHSRASENGGKKNMKGKNGSGCIKKWSGNRRKPYGAFAPGVPDKNGKVKQALIGSFSTKEEAEKALKKYALNDWEVPSDITLNELFEEWKETSYCRISKSTQNSYNAAWNRFASLHNKKIVDMKTRNYQNCIYLEAERGVSDSSLHTMKVIIGLVEGYALENDFINKGYVKFIKMPLKQKNEKEAFSEEDLIKIENAAKNGTGVADLVLIMCYTGWRINEFLQLKPEDFDTNEHTLRGGIKTDAGKNRVVPVPDVVMPYVQKWLDKKGQYIFCSATGGHMKDKTLRARFVETLEGLGIEPSNGGKFTPHSARHTYVTLLNRIGADTKSIMALSGHSDVKTSIGTYTHTDIKQLKKATGGLNTYLESISSELVAS